MVAPQNSSCPEAASSLSLDVEHPSFRPPFLSLPAHVFQSPLLFQYFALIEIPSAVILVYQPGSRAPPVLVLPTPSPFFLPPHPSLSCCHLQNPTPVSLSICLFHAGTQLKCCWRKSLILLQVYNHTPLLGVPTLLPREACVPIFRKICFELSFLKLPHFLLLCAYLSTLPDMSMRK